MANIRGELAVGCRVQVHWEGEGEWFEGVVDAYDPDRGYFVKYDDGEEQWEVDVGEHSMRFLSAPENLLPEEEPGVAVSARGAKEDNNEVFSRADPENYDEEYEEDHEDVTDGEEEANKSSSEHSSPRPEQQGVPELTGPVSNKVKKVAQAPQATKKQQRPAAFMRHSAVFFRDEESLREMRQELRQEKKTLTNQVHTLTMQLAEKEQLSTTLKAELQQLKTSATLASVMIQHKSATGSIKKGPPKPKTIAQWGERVLDQKLNNQRMTEELLLLKTAMQEKQIALQRKQQRRDELNAKLGRVPRRHLCTLVDLQVEVARLLEEKRTLETQPPRLISYIGVVETANSKTGATAKAKLQNELTSLELTAERYKEELRQWELKIDCEQARLAPLETRLASLQQELRQYEDSQVLLRSVFLRLRPDASDGCVMLEEALAAFQTLAPPNQPPLTPDEMKDRLTETTILSSTEKEHRFSFSQFVQAFSCLFKL